jgi:MYND finger
MKNVGKVSQCANCTALFIVENENNVLYCSEECERKHDIFLFTKGEIGDENNRIANQNVL